MGGKLLWTGLTFIMAFTLLSVTIPGVASIAIVGAVIMIIGLVFLWFNR